MAASHAEGLQQAVQRTTTASARQTVLLFINTQNFYCHEGSTMPQSTAAQHLQGCDLGYWCTRIAECKVKWQRLQQAARACGIEVIYAVTQSKTQDGRDRSLQHKISGLHIIPGSWEAQVINIIAPRPSELVLHKFTSSVFNSTPLDSLLRNMGKHCLIVAGCMTDECIDHAIRDAADFNYNVTLLTDCCAAPTAERHQQACNILSKYCRQQKLSSLLQELVASAAKTVVAPLAAVRRPSAAAGVLYPIASNAVPALDLQQRLSGLLKQAAAQDMAYHMAASAAPVIDNRFMLANAPLPAVAAAAAGALDAEGPAEHSSQSSPEDAEQQDMAAFVPGQQQQHNADSPQHESDGSGTDDLRADNAHMAEHGALKQNAKGGSNKRQSLQGRNSSPQGRKEPRTMYFEYAKQQWETEREFMLHNSQTWVEVAVKGDPSKLERGLVYCKLCRHHGKSNTFGRGYRGGKRTALREHMQTKDHRELATALEEGRISMPANKARLQSAEQIRALGQPIQLTEADQAADSASPGQAQPAEAAAAAAAAAEEPSTAAAASALMQLGTSTELAPAVGSHATPLTPSTLGSMLSAALLAQRGAAHMVGQALSPPTAAAAAGSSTPKPAGRTGVSPVVLAAAVAKIAAVAGLSREAIAGVTVRLHQYLQVAGDELSSEGAATAITVAFSGTAGVELSEDILKKALASLAGGSSNAAGGIGPTE